MAQYIDLECAVCQRIFPRLRKFYTYELKRSGEGYSPLCSPECKKKFRSTRVEVSCETCGVKFEKIPAEILKTAHNFCSHSCAAIYTNEHRAPIPPKNKVVCCVKCGNTTEIPANATNICDACRLQAKLEKPLPTSRCQACGVDIVLTSAHKRYCDLCRQVKASMDAINRVNALDNADRLKSIVCFYPFNNTEIRCDSKAEYSCLNYVETHFDVVDIKRCSLILTYELDGKVRRYNPDFEVILANNKRLIVECKTVLSNRSLRRKWSTYYASILPKRQALEKYCADNGCDVLLYNKDMNKSYYNRISREQLQNGTRAELVDPT